MRVRILERDERTNSTQEIVKRLNLRFRSEEQFEQQMDTICLDVAQELGGFFTRRGEVLIFSLSPHLISIAGVERYVDNHPELLN
jgi:hypothetical protein